MTDERGDETMNRRTRRPTKIFTVEEANKTLPLVRAIVSDITTLSREVMERRHRLNHLSAGRDLESDDVYSEELAEIEKDLERDMQRLKEYVQELRQLGVLAKGADGLVDFPAMMDGRLVYLCWKLGEPEVLYWHDVEAGYAGRQPLTADSVSGESLGNEGLATDEDLG
jgi:hypothetical protein